MFFLQQTESSLELLGNEYISCSNASCDMNQSLLDLFKPQQSSEIHRNPMHAMLKKEACDVLIIVDVAELIVFTPVSTRPEFRANVDALLMVPCSASSGSGALLMNTDVKGC